VFIALLSVRIVETREDFGVRWQSAAVRSAGFQTCRMADFQVGKALGITPFAGLETRDTADLEVCTIRRSNWKSSA